LDGAWCVVVAGETLAMKRLWAWCCAAISSCLIFCCSAFLRRASSSALWSLIADSLALCVFSSCCRLASRSCSMLIDELERTGPGRGLRTGDIACLRQLCPSFFRPKGKSSGRRPDMVAGSATKQTHGLCSLLCTTFYVCTVHPLYGQRSRAPTPLIPTIATCRRPRLLPMKP